MKSSMLLVSDRLNKVPKRYFKTILKFALSIIYRLSLNFPIVEYEIALTKFNGDANEAILQRIISNPIHVYKLVRDTEAFASQVVPTLKDSLTFESKEMR